MYNILYTLAIILIVLWAVGFIMYNLGPFIHVLLVLAVIAVILILTKDKDL